MGEVVGEVLRHMPRALGEVLPSICHTETCASLSRDLPEILPHALPEVLAHGLDVLAGVLKRRIEPSVCGVGVHAVGVAPALHHHFLLHGLLLHELLSLVVLTEHILELGLVFQFRKLLGGIVLELRRKHHLALVVLRRRLPRLPVVVHER